MKLTLLLAGLTAVCMATKVTFTNRMTPPDSSFLSALTEGGQYKDGRISKIRPENIYDIQILVGLDERPIYAHTSIISHYSPESKKIFSMRPAGSVMITMRLNNSDYEAMYDACSPDHCEFSFPAVMFLYTGKMTVKVEHLTQILAFFHSLRSPGLIFMCLTQSGHESIAEFFKFAVALKEDALADLAVSQFPIGWDSDVEFMRAFRIPDIFWLVESAATVSTADLSNAVWATNITSGRRGIFGVNTWSFLDRWTTIITPEIFFPVKYDILREILFGLLRAPNSRWEIPEEFGKSVIQPFIEGICNETTRDQFLHWFRIVSDKANTFRETEIEYTNLLVEEEFMHAFDSVVRDDGSVPSKKKWEFDIRFLVGPSRKTFEMHSFVLEKYSQSLRETIQKAGRPGISQGKEYGLFEMADMDEQEVRLGMEFMYTGKIAANVEELDRMFYFLHRIGADPLIHECARDISPLSAWTFFKFGLVNDDQAMLNLAIEKIPKEWYRNSTFLVKFDEPVMMRMARYLAQQEIIPYNGLPQHVKGVYDVETWLLLRRWTIAISNRITTVSAPKLLLHAVETLASTSESDSTEFQMTAAEVRQHVFGYVESLDEYDAREYGQRLVEWVHRSVSYPELDARVPDTAVFKRRDIGKSVFTRLGVLVSKDPAVRFRPQAWKLLYSHKGGALNVTAFRDAVDDRGPAVVIGRTQGHEAAERGATEHLAYFVAYNADGWARNSVAPTGNADGFIGAVRVRRLPTRLEVGTFIRRPFDYDGEFGIVNGDPATGKPFGPVFHGLDLGDGVERPVSSLDYFAEPSGALEHENGPRDVNHAARAQIKNGLGKEEPGQLLDAFEVYSI